LFEGTFLSTWRETLENAFKEIGDISGLNVFDAGPEGFVSRYLAERIGDGRIIGVNIWLEAYGKVRERVGDALMSKVVFIKDDMQHIDYLKDNFFDLVVSYDTLISIESQTPGGTFPILRQFHRILKHNGRFLTIEILPSDEVKPVDEAQELELKLREILDQIRPSGIAYMPRQLSEILKRIGFAEPHWKIVSQGEWLSPSEATEMIEGARNLANKRIQDEKERENILGQLNELAYQAKKGGLRTLPYYALYARKP